MREEVTEMQQATPRRRAVVALLAILALATAATPALAGGAVSQKTHARHLCPPMC
jgi:hypothetical protein